MEQPGSTLDQRLKRASRLLQSGAATKAANAYRKILSAAPEQEEARYNLAIAQAELGQFGDAIRGFRDVIAAMPDVAAAHAAFATSLRSFRIARFEPGVTMKPIAELREPLRAYTAATNAVLLIGECYASLSKVLAAAGRQLEAKLARDKAILFNQELQEAMFDLGATLACPGRLADALAMHRTALAQIPDHWQMSEQDYLASELTIRTDEIVTPDGLEVMMEWERPIMERSAEIVCHNTGDVLNVGFGMAIIDTAIQNNGVTTHTIIEAHPQVIERARQWAQDKVGVRIIPSTWQAALDQLQPLDGIYFDTLIPPILPFLRHAPKILKDGGVFSYFQYMIHLENLATMVRDDLDFGIEYLAFDDLPENTYYRLTDKNADGKFEAPLFLFRKRAATAS